MYLSARTNHNISGITHVVVLMLIQVSISTFPFLCNNPSLPKSTFLKLHLTGGSWLLHSKRGCLLTDTEYVHVDASLWCTLVRWSNMHSKYYRLSPFKILRQDDNKLYKQLLFGLQLSHSFIVKYTAAATWVHKVYHVVISWIN